MNTLLLDPVAWDLILDSNFNIAMASNPYSIAQDAASAIRTFQGEVYYNGNLGIPYFDQILGKNQNVAVAILAAQAEQAAETVPEVVSARTTALYYDNRTLSGVVEIIDTTGAANNVSF